MATAVRNAADRMLGRYIFLLNQEAPSMISVSSWLLTGRECDHRKANAASQIQSSTDVGSDEETIKTEEPPKNSFHRFSAGPTNQWRKIAVWNGSARYVRMLFKKLRAHDYC
jgi:hypothetical protein